MKRAISIIVWWVEKNRSAQWQQNGKIKQLPINLIETSLH